MKIRRYKRIVIATVVAGLVICLIKSKASLNSRKGISQVPKSKSNAPELAGPGSDKAVEAAPLADFSGSNASHGTATKENQRPSPISVYVLTVIQLLSFPVCGWIVTSLDLPLDDPVRRFFTGLFLGNFAALGYFVFEWLFSTSRSTRGASPNVKKNIFIRIWDSILNVHELLLYMFLMIIGVLVFHVSWEGEGQYFGKWFGYGALLAGLIFQFGVKRMIDANNPSIFVEQRMELQEILDLTRADNESSRVLLSSRDGGPKLPEGQPSKTDKPERLKKLLEKWKLE